MSGHTPNLRDLKVQLSRFGTDLDHKIRKVSLLTGEFRDDLAKLRRDVVKGFADVQPMLEDFFEAIIYTVTKCQKQKHQLTRAARSRSCVTTSKLCRTQLKP
eukprot:gb/GEZN01035029.1/.p1 GENE.gb/GEZN01035029.1/~~gb/GEZN01035029.1/.p1  ORF type:complete len:113 (-),score=5.26 gb/GEZN01035029.1/:45-350(-)